MSFSKENYIRFWTEYFAILPDALPRGQAFYEMKPRRVIVRDLISCAQKILAGHGNLMGGEAVAPGFSRETCLVPLSRALEQIDQSLASGKIGAKALRVHQELQAPINLLASYYARRATFYDEKQKKTEQALADEKAIISAVIERCHPDKLLDYFGDRASLAFDGGKTPVPAKDEPTGGLLRSLMVKKLIEEINTFGKDALGDPNVVRYMKQDVNSLSILASGSQTLSDHLEKFAEEVRTAFEEKKPEGKLLLFPSRPGVVGASQAVWGKKL